MSASEHVNCWPVFSRRTCIATLCAVMPSWAGAQSPPAVTPADIERATRTRPVITDRDIDHAAKKHRMPTEAELARVPVPGSPQIGALPQPLIQRHIDLGAIAKGFEAKGQRATGAEAVREGPTLLVFVSFSMPSASLSRLVDQAARIRAILVLRGFVEGSLQKTVLQAQNLIGQRKVGFQIDPQAFDRFSVGVTPTFVLLKAGALPAPCAAGICFPTSSYVSVAGDVSIDYALEYFKRSAPAFRRDAGTILDTLKGRS